MEFSMSNDDERIAKRANGRNNERTDRNISENRDNTDAIRKESRRALLREQNVVLPSPPETVDKHYCWVSTTHNNDTIEHRFRRGYSFVTPSELPNFQFNTQKSGQATEDRIMINEMVLMQIDKNSFLEDMEFLHVEEPLRVARVDVDAARQKYEEDLVKDMDRDILSLPSMIKNNNIRNLSY